jgi:hypothetical protein
VVAAGAAAGAAAVGAAVAAALDCKQQGQIQQGQPHTTGQHTSNHNLHHRHKQPRTWLSQSLHAAMPPANGFKQLAHTLAAHIPLLNFTQSVSWRPNDTHAHQQQWLGCQGLHPTTTRCCYSSAVRDAPAAPGFAHHMHCTCHVDRAAWVQRVLASRRPVQLLCALGDQTNCTRRHS